MTQLGTYPLTPPTEEGCGVCAHGCSCTGADRTCGHYGCYGAGPRDCPAAAAQQAAYEQQLTATRAQRTRLHALRAASSPDWRPPALGLLP